MDTEVRALAAGAQLMVGEAAEERLPAQLDRAAALPLPISLVRGLSKPSICCDRGWRSEGLRG